MALKASYEFLFVGRDDNSFLENYAYDLLQDHGERSGQIFVNLEIQNNPVDAEEVAAAIFDTMQKAFFEDINVGPYERFEYALKAINDVLNDIKSQKLSGYIGSLNIVIAAIVGDMLYITQCGDAEAYLIRKRYVSVVTEGLNDGVEEETDVFVNIASGQIEPGDLVLFSSTRLLRYIGKNDLARTVNIRSISSSLGEIKDLVSTEILGRIGLTGILFSKPTNNEIIDFSLTENHVTEDILVAHDSEVYAERDSISGKFMTTLESSNSSLKKPNWLSEAFSKISEGSGSLFSKIGILKILIIVIIILLIGVWVARGNSKEKIKLEELDATLNEVQTKISEAQTKGIANKEIARQLLDDAYQESKDVLNSGYYREKAYMFLTEIEVARDRLDGVQRVKEQELFLDLNTVYADMNALGFVEVDNKLYFYEENALYELILDKIQGPIELDKQESVIAASGFDQAKSLVFLTKSGKLMEYKSGNISFMDTSDGSFKKGVAIDDWSNRLYILDDKANQIWRYTFDNGKSSFGPAEAYLQSTEEVDFSNAKDISIDANIYVLSSLGEITKLFSGKKADFTINNAPFDTYEDTGIILTAESMDQIFIMDQAQARLYIFNKDKDNSGNITYDKQYLFEGLEEGIRDIHYAAQDKQIYLLTKNKIYKADL